MIRHTVLFKLKHQKNSPEEASFFASANKLQSIPGVKNFELLKILSQNNEFDFGISMEFDDQATYMNYTNHADHTNFVKEIWLNEVVAFNEIDYELYSAS